MNHSRNRSRNRSRNPSVKSADRFRVGAWSMERGSMEHGILRLLSQIQLQRALGARALVGFGES